MKDQLEKLTALGIDAVQFNSSLHRDDELAAIELVESGAAKIVFCTPERLTSPAFSPVLARAPSPWL